MGILHSHVLEMDGPYFFPGRVFSVWACFWGILGVWGLVWAGLAWESSQERSLGREGMVPRVGIAWLDS